MSQLRAFSSSLPPDPNQSADSSAGQADFSPDAFFAQTLQASGYTLGNDPCLDKCWEEFQRCLQKSTDGGVQCMAQLTACQRSCATATADSLTAPASDNQVLAAAGAPSAGAGNTPATGAGNTPDPTDDSGLSSSDTVHVSPDGGTTDEPFPKPDVEYDFDAKFDNKGKLPSGPCFVRFILSGDIDFQKDFDLDDGLKAGASVLAVVHFGTFPNKFLSYTLTACIFSKSAPDKAIGCAGSFEFAVNTV